MCSRQAQPSQPRLQTEGATLYSVAPSVEYVLSTLVKLCPSSRLLLPAIVLQTGAPGQAT